MANGEIEFFDLPSKGDVDKCWSPNTWYVSRYLLYPRQAPVYADPTCRKGRIVLNFKSVPYRTTWLEYPEVAPKLKEFGVPPNAEGVPYTLPTIRLPDGSFVMDSKNIAVEMEKRHPKPSLHLDAAEVKEAEALAPKIMLSLKGVLWPMIPKKILNPVSATYFEETRHKRVGMPLEELGRTSGGERAWKEAEPALKALDELYKKHKGPFLLGEDMSFGDLIYAGALHYFGLLGDGIYERVVSIAPSLKPLHEASKVLLERDDH